MTQEWPLPSPASVDTALEALSNGSRREILLSLSAPDGPPIAQDALVESADRAHTIELLHHHLPKLDDEEFLEWDREAGELRRGPRFEAVEPLLETFRDHDS